MSPSTTSPPPPHPLLVVAAAASSSSSTTTATTTATTNLPPSVTAGATTPPPRQRRRRGAQGATSSAASPNSKSSDDDDDDDDNDNNNKYNNYNNGFERSSATHKSNNKKRTKARAGGRSAPRNPSSEGENDRTMRIMVQEVVSALSEAQAELRDAKREVEALQETCHALSASLQASEEDKLELVQQLELLQLQMSSVCYVDMPRLRKHHDAMDNNETPKASPASKAGARPGPLFQATAMAASPDDNRHSRAKGRVPAAGGERVAAGSWEAAAAAMGADDPMPRDEERSGVCGDATERTRTSAGSGEDAETDPGGGAAVDASSVPEPGTAVDVDVDVDVTVAPHPHPPPQPSLQAAFQRALRERDQARQCADQYRSEVKMRREQVRTLRRQLLQSAALIELSYQPQDADGDGDDDIDDDDLDSSDDSGENRDEDRDEGRGGTKEKCAASESKMGSPLRSWLQKKRGGDRRTSRSPTQPASPPRTSGAPHPPPQPSSTDESAPSSPLPLPSPPLAAAIDEKEPAGRHASSTQSSSLWSMTGVSRDDVATATPEAGPSHYGAADDRYMPDLFRPPPKDDSGRREGGVAEPSLSISRSSSSSSLSSDADMAAGGFVPAGADASATTTTTTTTQHQGPSLSPISPLANDSTSQSRRGHALRPSEMVASTSQSEANVEGRHSSPRAVKGRLVEL